MLHKDFEREIKRERERERMEGEFVFKFFTKSE